MSTTGEAIALQPVNEGWSLKRCSKLLKIDQLRRSHYCFSGFWQPFGPVWPLSLATSLDFDLPASSLGMATSFTGFSTALMLTTNLGSFSSAGLVWGAPSGRTSVLTMTQPSLSLTWFRGVFGLGAEDCGGLLSLYSSILFLRFFEDFFW